jgi:beta-glucosidase
MAKSKTIPGEWGALASQESLSAEETEVKIRKLLAQMTPEEKLAHMSGDEPFFPRGIQMAWIYNYHPYPAGENPRLGLPGVRFSDGPRGIVVDHATCFPVSMARGATWDLEMEEHVGEVMGVEARSLGANLVAGVCINLLRHPAWGRAQETYGEDTYHLGEMGAALTRGLQKHVMACAKHFACNSIENNRTRVNVKITERTLREVYLPHFKRCVDEGIASVMSAYNKVNGEYCGQNRRLLTTILKDEWGFEGFVMSDFVFGVHDGKAALRAGLDLEMPFQQHYGRKLLRKIMEHPELEALVDNAVLRLLKQKARFARVDEPGRYREDLVASEPHRALARRVAVKSMVLLKNEIPDEQAKIFDISGNRIPWMAALRGGADELKPHKQTASTVYTEPVLPIHPFKIKRLALIGKLAEMPNTGDRGSSMVRPAEVITPLQGIQAAIEGQCEVIYYDGTDVRKAARLAKGADIAVVIAGNTHKDEGERVLRRGGDRKSLRLSPMDEVLILSVVGANPRTAVVLMGGGPIIVKDWLEFVPAVLMAWYPGMEGGAALAEVLLGKANPSGKLPCAFPASTDQLPYFNNKADEIEYGYYHGYRLMEKESWQPTFPFGFGLSYTTFSYRNLWIETERLAVNGKLHARIEVANSGLRAGEEVVQLYIAPPGKAVDRPVKELKGFKRIALAPGEHCTVEFMVPVEKLAYYDEAGACWRVEEGEYRLLAGSSSAEKDLLETRFWVEGS